MPLTKIKAHVLLASLAMAAPAQAEDASFASASAKGTVSAARLLSAGPMAAGAYRAGVEITLGPGAITYWRQPGEAGSPPVFDFAASTNVTAVEPGFPAPKHLDEAGTMVAGYDSNVIFPLKVTPKDPKLPVTLALKLDYAVCGKICMPAKASLSLILPRSGVSPHAAEIAAAQQRVPVKIDAAEARKRFSLKKTGADAWLLHVAGSNAAQDVFTEVPEPLFLESRRDGGDFLLKLFATGEKASGADATLTIVTDKGAFEAPARLD
jgi:DsbC/DsbD-like thiol-disulfide interchange protein